MQGVGLDVSLAWHLQSNHYPPLPNGCVAIAKRAIAHAHECDGFSPFTYESCEHTVDISAIGTHLTYGTDVPVRELIEAWHLDFYLEDMQED